jgi:electron transfer flavoprotein alpha subunit
MTMDADYLDALMGSSAPSSGGTGGGSDIWVVAETREEMLSLATLEVVGAARGLADRLGAYVRVALLGADIAGLAEALLAHGADRVALAEDARLSPFNPESHLSVLSAHFAEARPEILLFVASQNGDDLAARLAARIGGGLITDCIALDLDEATRTVIARRPVYRGLYEEEWTIPQAEPEVYAATYDFTHRPGPTTPSWAEPQVRPQVFTLRPGAFAALPPDRSRSGEVERISVALAGFQPRVRRLDAGEYSGPLNHHGEASGVPLYRAQRIVAVGRALGDENGEGLALAGQLATHLGAVLAGDHSAYGMGWVDDAHVVGITGPALAPELYVACGIRGDAQHLAGMSDSRFVVAIHSDPDAPIFKMADVGIVGPPVEVLRALLDQV